MLVSYVMDEGHGAYESAMRDVRCAFCCETGSIHPSHRKRWEVGDGF